jgi:hypothetical protein
MAKDNRTESRELSDVVSIIGPGMQVVGDCTSDGVVRIEGRVEGVIRAAKSVVVGKDGFVTGDIETQDLIVAGRVAGTITAQSTWVRKRRSRRCRGREPGPLSCPVPPRVPNKRGPLRVYKHLSGRTPEPGENGELAAARQQRLTAGPAPPSRSCFCGVFGRSAVGLAGGRSTSFHI